MNYKFKKIKFFLASILFCLLPLTIITINNPATDQYKKEIIDTIEELKSNAKNSSILHSPVAHITGFTLAVLSIVKLLEQFEQIKEVKEHNNTDLSENNKTDVTNKKTKGIEEALTTKFTGNLRNQFMTAIYNDFIFDPKISSLLNNFYINTYCKDYLKTQLTSEIAESAICADIFGTLWNYKKTLKTLKDGAYAALELPLTVAACMILLGGVQWKTNKEIKSYLENTCKKIDFIHDRAILLDTTPVVAGVLINHYVISKVFEHYIPLLARTIEEACSTKAKGRKAIVYAKLGRGLLNTEEGKLVENHKKVVVASNTAIKTLETFIKIYNNCKKLT
jgi:hypothetical protein